MLQGIIFILSLRYALILEKYDTLKKRLRKRSRVKLNDYLLRLTIHNAKISYRYRFY